MNLLIPDLLAQLRSELTTRTRPQGPSPVQPPTPARSTAAPQDFQPGRQVTAQLLEALGQNRFAAQAGAQRFVLQLPESAQPGQTLRLLVTGRTDTQINARQLPDTQGAPGQPVSGQEADLSPAAKAIARLLSQPAGPPTSSARNPAPVLPSPPAQAQAQVLAPALRAQVESSGLFYESHVREWVVGKRPLTALREEPQGKLEPLTHDPPPSKGEKAQGGIPREAMAESLRDTLAPLVQRQLDTLANRQIHWQGEFWPGMPVDWEIQEDDANAHAPGDPERPWTTRVRTRLPTLGDVEAIITLSGPRTGVTLRCGPDSLARLEAATGDLAQGLTRAGLHVAAIRTQLARVADASPVNASSETTSEAARMGDRCAGVLVQSASGVAPPRHAD